MNAITRPMMTETPTAEQMLDALRSTPIPAVQIWWSREWHCYIASAPAMAGVVAVGNTIPDAAEALQIAIDAWNCQQ